MKRSLNLICILLTLFFYACSRNLDHEEKAIEPLLEETEEIVEKESLDSDADKIELTIEDYYYLLPDSPYFETEVGDVSRQEREEGLIKLNVKNGYIKGGHSMGPHFTMALFKNREDNIDYIMVQRLQFPGDMFQGFFDFMKYENDEWISAMELFENADEARDKYFTANLEDEEIISPVIPEKGIILEFCSWDPPYGEGMKHAELEYSYTWNGEEFEFVKE